MKGKYVIRFCLIAAAIQHSLFIFSQPSQILFQHLSVNEGLSDNTVTAFAQEGLGFIWIATSDGLNRYDGYEVKVFHHRPMDSTSIPANQVRTLYTDATGRLWIGTSNGLAFYDQHSQRFDSFYQYVNNEHSLTYVKRLC